MWLSNLYAIADALEVDVRELLVPNDKSPRKGFKFLFHIIIHVSFILFEYLHFVQNLLRESQFSLEKIASLVNVSLDFVKEVKKEMGKR
jgi:hypothetical protein